MKTSKYLETLTSIRQLYEAAESREYMTAEETSLKKLIQEILENEHGFYGPAKHATYAKRLKKFVLHIIPKDEDPDFTAAISFDTGIIYISEDFATDKSPLNMRQLAFLMRHELSHNFLMHQIRMMHKLNESIETPWEHLQYSATMHQLFNIIEDFEISNRKYSEEDKKMAVNLKVNGRVIHGLITEEHRKEWVTLSVEEMYDFLLKEIDAMNASILAARAAKADDTADPMAPWVMASIAKECGTDMIRGDIAMTQLGYSNLKSPSSIKVPLEKFINSSTFKTHLAEPYKQIVLHIYNNYKKPETEDDKEVIFNIMRKIADSSPAKKFELDGELALYTPEEKAIAVDTFKQLLGIVKDKRVVKVERDESASEEYVKIYNAVVAALNNDDWTIEDLEALLAKAGLAAGTGKID